MCAWLLELRKPSSYMLLVFLAVFSGELMLASLADRILSYTNSGLIQCGNAFINPTGCVWNNC